MVNLAKVFERARQLASRSLPGQRGEMSAGCAGVLQEKCKGLLSAKGEVSGTKLAQDILYIYALCDAGEKLKFFECLSQDFGPDQNALLQACADYRQEQDTEALQALMSAIEPPRQELLRRLNLAPGGTASLVSMRSDLLKILRDYPTLKAVDTDFLHLFRSWFNTGFLTLERISWSSPAIVLERLIKYEAVHAIQGWGDLKNRLAPTDRLCYAFFHPSLVDEPLIFVEVALSEFVPTSIQKVLQDERVVSLPETAKTAAFYSISNCQAGLKGISFGNFLIKQVAQSLKAEFPNLEKFVTLSPLPSFRDWMDRDERAKDFGISTEDYQRLAYTPENDDVKSLDALKMPVFTAAISYLTEGREKDGRPIDSVARFHLGNGARIESLQWQADVSDRGLERSLGVMVNYAYDLNEVETNHEAFKVNNIVALSPAMKTLLKKAGRSS